MQQETKKAVWPIVWLIAVIAAVFIGGFFFVRQTGSKNNQQAGVANSNNIENASSGYAMVLPSSWRVEQDRGDSMAVYPIAGCKIEFSTFAPLGAESQSAWISEELSKDPTLQVSEGSSDGLTVSGAPAIRWNGTIDGASTTLIYIFAARHVYEVAPSSLNEAPIAPGCAPYLDVFLQNVTLGD